MNSVEKVLKLNPAALADSEHIHLNDLINQRFDERIHCYENGKKLWDIATTNVVAITGSKR